MKVLGYHPQATYGMRKRGNNGHGAQAMYDAGGNIIKNGFSAGSADRVNPDGSWAAFLAHLNDRARFSCKAEALE
jgi:hypothetical protein